MGIEQNLNPIGASNTLILLTSKAVDFATSQQSVCVRLHTKLPQTPTY